MHGQTSKQARTIDLQFNLAPRNRPTNSRQDDPNSDNGPASRYDPNGSASSRRVIDAQNEQEFPSLGNAPVTIRPTVALNTRQFGTSGLARTKENFPALGGNEAAPRPITAPNMPQASAILFKAPTPTKPPKSAANSAQKQKVIVAKSTHDFPALPGGNASTAFSAPVASSSGSNKANNTKQKANAANAGKAAKDFPSLLGHASAGSSRSNNHRDLESDLIEMVPAYDLATVSSKHRALVQSYESVSSSGQVNQKIKTVQRVETKPQASNMGSVPLINSNKSFPALGGSGGGSSKTASAPQWLGATTTKTKKEPVQSKKSKVAPAPLLPTSKPSKSNSETNSNSTNETPKKSGKAKEPAESAVKADTKPPPNSKQAKKANGKAESNTNKENNGDKTKTSNQKSKKAIATNGNASSHLLNGFENGAVTPSPAYETINSYSAVATFTMPPPGFPAKPNTKVVRAPPGFESAIADTQSTAFAYISPSNALQRNQVILPIYSRMPGAHSISSISTDADQSFHEIIECVRRR